MSARFSTSPLGFGLATVMRLPGTADQLRVLDAAYSAGFRHFDVAPAYGLGRAETVFGDWLKKTGADVTVATKVGLPPSQAAKCLALVQGPLRRGLAASPRLRRLVKARSGFATAPTAGPSATQIEDSLDRSIQEIGRPPDVLLLHEVSGSALGDDAVAALRRLREDGSTSYIGASGPRVIAEESADRLAVGTVVLQTPIDFKAGVVGTARHGGPGVGELRYGLLSCYLEPLTHHLQSSELGRSVEAVAGLPLRTKADVASLLTVLAVNRWPDDTLLVGSTNEANIKRLGAAVQTEERPGSEALDEVLLRLQPYLR